MSYLLSFKEFADGLGIARNSIYKKVKSGSLPFVDDNGKQKIDMDDNSVKEYILEIEEKTGQSFSIKTKEKTKPRQTKVVKIIDKPKTRQTPKQEKPPKTDSGQSIDDLLKDIPDHLIEALDKGKLTTKQALSLPKVMLEKLKIYESTKQTKIKAQQLKGKLIDREIVKKVFGVIHEIDISQVIASKSKIASAMAALFECDDNNKITEAEEKINDILYKVLKSEEIEIEKFLKKLK